MYVKKRLSMSGLIGCLIRRTGLLGAYAKGLAHLHLMEYEEAYRIWHRLAQQGDARAQFDLGVMLLGEGLGVRGDNEKAIHWLTQAASQDHAEAENYLGAIYKTGAGAAQNLEKALHYFKKAGDHGHEGARESYAELLAGGLPDPHDHG